MEHPTAVRNEWPGATCTNSMKLRNTVRRRGGSFRRKCPEGSSLCRDETFTCVMYYLLIHTWALIVKGWSMHFERGLVTSVKRERHPAVYRLPPVPGVRVGPLRTSCASVRHSGWWWSWMGPACGKEEGEQRRVRVVFWSYTYIYRILVPTSRAHTFLFLQEECSERNCWVVWSLRDSVLKRVVSAGHEGSYPCALVKSVVGHFLATPIGV